MVSRPPWRRRQRVRSNKSLEGGGRRRRAGEGRRLGVVEMSRFRLAEVQPVTSGRRPLLAGSRLSPLVPTNEVMAKLSDPPNSVISLQRDKFAVHHQSSCRRVGLQNKQRHTRQLLSVQPSDSGYQPVGEPDILETTEYTTRVTR